MPGEYYLLELYKNGGFPATPPEKLLGFTVKSLEYGHCVIEFTPTAQHANPMGIAHGGILSAVADEAMAMAYLATLREGELFSTLEMKINFLQAVRGETLTFDAKILRKKGSVGLAECRITDQEGNLVAFATSGLMTRKPVKQGDGSLV